MSSSGGSTLGDFKYFFFSFTEPTVTEFLERKLKVKLKI
jgi:hypothetical protein